MNGPQFLILYAVLEIILISAGYWIVRNLIGKPHAHPTGSPEPLPVAYMAGGTHYLFYTILYRLHVLGKIEFTDSYKDVEAVSTPEPIRDEIEKALYNHLSGPKKLYKFRTAQITATLRNAIERHILFGMNPGLIFSHEVRTKAVGVRNIVMILLFSIAALRIFIGVSNGMSRFMFLVFLVIIGLITTWYMLALPATTRASEDYIMHLKILNPLPSKQIFKSASSQQKALYIALYGPQMLSHLGWKNVYKTYLNNVDSGSNSSYSGSSTSCSSGCSTASVSSCGSGDSGSSCGGCGGCGGGGD